MHSPCPCVFLIWCRRRRIPALQISSDIPGPKSDTRGRQNPSSTAASSIEIRRSLISGFAISVDRVVNQADQNLLDLHDLHAGLPVRLDLQFDIAFSFRQFRSEKGQYPRSSSSGRQAVCTNSSLPMNFRIRSTISPARIDCCFSCLRIEARSVDASPILTRPASASTEMVIERLIEFVSRAGRHFPPSMLTHQNEPAVRVVSTLSPSSSSFAS